jgi:hypothetical protein
MLFIANVWNNRSYKTEIVYASNTFYKCIETTIYDIPISVALSGELIKNNSQLHHYIDKKYLASMLSKHNQLGL